MDINQIPFDAFALESLATASSSGPSQTLTLQLSLGPLPGFTEPMTGTACIPATHSQGQLHATVLPAAGGDLTITFQI
ncbi:MAG: hypothetical protein V4669_08260 [Pseudomonadota bacterium]